jgi:hypothetical protein
MLRPATGFMAYSMEGVVKAESVELPVEHFNGSSTRSTFQSESEQCLPVNCPSGLS